MYMSSEQEIRRLILKIFQHRQYTGYIREIYENYTGNVREIYGKYTENIREIERSPDVLKAFENDPCAKAVISLSDKNRCRTNVAQVDLNV